MARFSRIKLTDQPSVYHVCSRTALDGLPFKADDKNIFVKLIQHFSSIYFTEILGFCVMDNHFHILLRMHTKSEFSDEEIEKRHALYYGKDCFFNKRQIPLLSCLAHIDLNPVRSRIVKRPEKIPVMIPGLFEIFTLREIR